MRRTRPPRRAHAAVLRTGFTLAELIVGIMLLTVGLGALAGTSAWIVRESSAARRAERAAQIARSRLELLRLRPCGGDAGEEAHGDLVERWSLTSGMDRAVAVVAVTARDSGRMAEQRYQAAFPC